MLRKGITVDDRLFSWDGKERWCWVPDPLLYDTRSRRQVRLTYRPENISGKYNGPSQRAGTSGHKAYRLLQLVQLL